MFIKVTYKTTHYYGPSERKQMEYPIYINIDQIERFYSQRDTIVESDERYKKELMERYNGTVINLVRKQDHILVAESIEEVLRLIQEAGGKNAI